MVIGEGMKCGCDLGGKVSNGEAPDCQGHVSQEDMLCDWCRDQHPHLLECDYEAVLGYCSCDPDERAANYRSTPIASSGIMDLVNNH